MTTTNFNQFTPNIGSQIVPDFTKFSSVEVEQPRILDLSNIGIQEEIPNGIEISEDGKAIVQDTPSTTEEKITYSQSQLFEPEQTYEIPVTQAEPVIQQQQQNSAVKTNYKSNYSNKMRLNNKQKSIAMDLMSGLINRGFSPIEAAGLLGNMAAESGFNYSAWNGNDLGSASGGLVQWRGDRLNKLKSYAKSQGKPWTNKDIQLDFITKELEESYSHIRNKSRASSTPYDASESFAGYEGYAGYDRKLSSARTLQKSKKWSDSQTMDWINKEHESRGNYAEEIYKLWQDSQ